MLAGFILTSCGNEGCYETRDVKVYCHFSALNDLNQASAVEFDSMTIVGVGSDSILYKDEKLSELALELNPKANLTQFVVYIKAKGSNYYFKDTLSLYHTNDPWFQSMDCGCMIFSKLDSCKTTGSIFKSVTIKDSTIVNKKSEHVILHL